MLRLLGNRDFSLLFAGNFVSRIGSTFYNFAIGWFILELTGSPLAMGGYIALSGIVEWIATPFAGVFVDRLNKVRILYMTDFIRGGAVLLGGFALFVMGESSSVLLVLYAITIVLALNNALFFPANNTLIPEIVKDNELNQANSFFALINSIQAIIGILLAGLLYALLGIEMIFLINGISFIVSAISEMFIRTRREAKAATSVKPSFRREFVEGFTYMRNQNGMITFFIAVLFLNFAFAPVFANALPYLYNLALSKPASHLASANIAYSSGLLLGGIVVGTLGQRIIVSNSMRKGLLITCLCMLTVAALMHVVTSTNLAYLSFMMMFLPLLFVMAVANMFINIPFSTGLFRIVDQNVRGRVISILNTFGGALVPLSFLIGGAVLEYGSLSVLVFSVCLLIIFPFSIIMFHPRVSQLLKSM